MLTHFKDKASGTDWAQASGVLRGYYESGITPAQVRANLRFFRRFRTSKIFFRRRPMLLYR